MSLLLSGFAYDQYLFVPMALILQFLVIEILPLLYILDQTFLNKMLDKPVPTLVEPLFEEQARSRLDISADYTD